MMIAAFLLFLISFNAVHSFDYSIFNIKPHDDDDTPLVAVADIQHPGSCAEAVPPWGRSGVYKIQIPDTDIKPFYVYCQVDPQDGPAWTIVQRRMDGSIDFYRNWEDYAEGFGNIAGEYFIGLEKLHAITGAEVNELWIEMEDFENQTRYAKYSAFAIGDESLEYSLNLLGTFSGNAGDSLTKQGQGQKFSTKDRKNDNYGIEDCAIKFTGAWWYKWCHDSNLNGQYLRGEYPKDKYAQGIDWNTWHGHYYSLKYVHMAVRPTQFVLKSVVN